MIFLVHSNAQSLIKVIIDGNPLNIASRTCTSAFWELAQKFPEEIIIWCEIDLEERLMIKNFEKIFHHDLIMASFSVNTSFLPDSIGYVDQLPFVKINKKVLYPTWQMSSDVGGIKGKVLLKFKNILRGNKNFRFLLNSIGKLGQPNGLFCYSAPELISKSSKNSLSLITCTTKELFQFTYMHYSTPRIFILFLCHLWYEKRFSLKSLLLIWKKKKLFQKEVDLSSISAVTKKEMVRMDTIDVIVPTMGRSSHLFQVVQDLSRQSFHPKKVIIVEQNPDISSESELNSLYEITWPFELEIQFIHQTGACNARNLALSRTTADLVFFCDDDNRLSPQLLEEMVGKMKLYGLNVLVTAYLQPNEKLFFNKVKQWGTFGAGNSIASRKAIEGILFSSTFEFGYGEDVDFGMQLRNSGFDIIYHPSIKITHLKAPMGGFREKPALPWEQGEILPKPSPTVMALALKYYTPEQIRGFKVSLFLKFYKHSASKNPVSYIRKMNLRWKLSEKWARMLLIDPALKLKKG